ncbi:odorant receptor 49b-like [Periplaneta americana]|uniref:odorant receptor 49b-like n=1 Tax=Periplaneta americana TaxID=6978 RepID=UPI0037E74C19
MSECVHPVQEIPRGARGIEVNKKFYLNFKGMLILVIYRMSLVFMILTSRAKRLQEDTLKRLFTLTESFAWTDMPLIDKETGEVTMAGWLRRIDKIWQKVVITELTFHFSQSAVRMFAFRDTIFPCWYPFDIYASPAYEVILLTQILASVRYTCVFCSTSYLYSKVVCIACVQLEKLRVTLLRIKKYAVSSDTNSELKNQENNDEINSTNEQLRQIIKHHTLILRYINLLQEVTKLMAGGMLFLFLLSLCMTAFSAIMSWGDFIDMSQSVFIYIGVLLMAFSYCSIGTALAREYEAVKDAAFACDWIGTPVTFQRSIAIIMSIANKGKALLGGIVPMTNETLMAMVNESMSLFMFLLAMKDKSEGKNE